MTDWLSPDEWQAVRLSLRVSFWAMTCSLPLGLLVAHALARWRFPGRGLLNGLVHLPLIMPPVVTGFVLLRTFGRNGSFGRFWTWLTGQPFTFFSFDWTGAALAAGVMAFPLMVRTIRLSIEAVDPGLEAAAATLGASRLRVFLTVTLPLIAPGIIAGAILSFAKAMGEFGATITFVSSIPGKTQTLPSAIYAFLQVPGGGAAAARLVWVAIILSMGALALSEWLGQRVARRVGGG
ncbi:MAG: molybdate ABC transporter permease subunit [Rubellimicrobium sp.]|nr:molybdate ABC transporter permease subunit [Rubellimicrobium sp.]